MPKTPRLGLTDQVSTAKLWGLRYGDLTLEQIKSERPKMTLKTVAKISRMTVSQLLFRLGQHRQMLENNDFNNVDIHEINGIKRNPELSSLLSQEVMREQAILSLQQRVAIARQKGFELSKTGLSRAYKQTGIRFKDVRFKRKWRRQSDDINKEKTSSCL